MSLTKPHSTRELSDEGLEIVRDQIARDIDETGAGVNLVKVESSWRGVQVYFRQWEPYGIARSASQDLDLGSTAPKNEEALRRVITKRFSKVLRRQAALSERFGSVIDGKEAFDPSLVTIDDPLAGMLARFYPSAFKPLVMRSLRKETHFDWSGVPIAEALARHGVTDLDMEVNRAHIQGSFTIRLEDATLVWKNGSLSILNGGTFPESALLALRGKILSKVVQHPLFDPDLEITAAGPVRKEGIDGTTLTLKGHAIPLTQAFERARMIAQETT